MRLEQLDYLIAIEHYHSMNKAAENIFVSQQSISNAIMQLEEEFQTNLVLRTNKGSFLTEAGQALSQAAQDFYNRCELIKTTHQYRPTSAKLHLLLEYSQLSLWDSLFLYYSTHYANIELEHTLIDYIHLEEALIKYPDSVAISYLHDDYLEKFSQKYTCQIIKTYPLSLYVSKNSPLAQSKSLSIKSLHNMKILLYAPKNKPSTLLFLLEKYHLESRGNHYIYQMTTNLQNKLSQHSDVICFAPTSPAVNFIDNMIAIPLKEKLSLHLCCITKNPHLPLELVKAMENI